MSIASWLGFIVMVFTIYCKHGIMVELIYMEQVIIIK